jgi:hypothetical protein
MNIARLALAATLALAPVTAAADVFRSSQSWGAIAYAPGAETRTGTGSGHALGEWGWARNFATRLGAEQSALAACRGTGARGCELAVVMQAACGALAVGRRGWGAGGGANPQAARARALGSCRQSSPGCAVQIEFCASPPGAPIAVFR